MRDAIRSPFDGQGSPFGFRHRTTLAIYYPAISFAVSDQPYQIAGIYVEDTSDDGSGVYELTLAVTDGDLTLAQVTGLSFTVGDGTADATMTFSGTIADINAALATVTIDNASEGTPTLTIPFGTASSPNQVSALVGMTITNSDTLFSPLYAAAERGGWWDPSDFSKMYQTEDTSTPVTATGQSVGRIEDKSGNGNHLVQATSTKRPTLQQDGNGKYYLSFDGTDDFLATASAATLTGTDEMSVFAAIRKASDAAIGTVIETSANRDSNNGTLYLIGPASAAAQSMGLATRGTSNGGFTYTNAAVAAAVTFNYIGLIDISVPSQEGRVNGSSVGTSGSALGGGNFTSQTIYVGARAGTSRFFNGRIYQLALRNKLTSGAALTDADTFLNGKSGAV